MEPDNILDEITSSKVIKVKDGVHGKELSYTINTLGVDIFGVLLISIILLPFSVFKEAPFADDDFWVFLLFACLFLYLYLILRFAFAFRLKKTIILDETLIGYSTRLIKPAYPRILRVDDVKWVRTYSKYFGIQWFSLGLKKEAPITEIRTEQNESIFIGRGLTLDLQNLLGTYLETKYNIPYENDLESDANPEKGFEE